MVRGPFEKVPNYFLNRVEKGLINCINILQHLKSRKQAKFELEKEI